LKRALNDELLAILRCPEDHSLLSPAEAPLVARLNAAIREGRLVNRSGQRVERTLEGGLVRAVGDRLYPIVDQIPIMLQDESIPLDQLDGQGD
jgi:uncharacterized protein YbaR (Trm112 family)